MQYYKQNKNNKYEMTNSDLMYNTFLILKKGFTPVNEIAQKVLEKCKMKATSENLEKAQKILHSALISISKDEKYWPVLTHCDRLEKALDDIAKLDIAIFENYCCCIVCAKEKIKDDMKNIIEINDKINGYLYYTDKDIENSIRLQLLYIHIGSTNNDKTSTINLANKVIDILRSYDFDAQFDESRNDILIYSFEWKKRRPTNEQ